MGMVWEPKSIYSKSERRNGGGEGVCCSGEGSTEEEIGWNTPSLISLKLLMGHQFWEQDSQWVGKESEEKSESGGWTKMAENSSSMDWVVQDLMVGEEQDMNAMVQQRQNDNMVWQHANCACMAMAPSASTQSASLGFSKLLGLQLSAQDLPSSCPTPAFPLHFHNSLFDSHSNPPLPFLPYSSPLQPSASDSRDPGRKRARITPSVSCVPVIRRSSNSDPSKPKRNGSRNPACHALNTNLKPRAKQGCANDPQSIAARQRRERISERLKILQDLIPNGSKVDLVTMLEKAINYVKFLQLQVKVLMNDEFWATQQEQENPDQPSSDITSSHEYNGSM